jgi:hypothetical protein
MKRYLTICLAFGLPLCLGRAQDVPSGPGATPPGAEAPTIATTTAADEAYATLLKQQFELSAQFRLLGSLAQEHRKLSDQAAKANQADKSLWEDQLAKELSQRCSAMLKQLNEATKQRAAFEKAHTDAGNPLGSLSAAATATRLSSREVEFLSKLDEGLQRVDQELSSARQNATAYATQITTNTIAYDFERASFTIEQNARKVRQLEQERFDLELRRLEFLALRRP